MTTTPTPTTPLSTDRVTVVVPARFWWDHVDRDCVNHSGDVSEYLVRTTKVDTTGGKVTSRRTPLLTLSLHPYDVCDLLSDADYYADPYTAREMGDLGLASSARAITRAIQVAQDHVQSGLIEATKAAVSAHRFAEASASSDPENQPTGG